jgi:hypothetical protein
MRLNVANNCNKTSKEIRTYVEAILPSLAGYSTEVIVRVIEEFMASCMWWPKLAELVERAQAMAQSIAYDKQLKKAQLPMPTELSYEQRRANIVAIKNMRQQLAQKRRMTA